jgi:transposase
VQSCYRTIAPKGKERKLALTAVMRKLIILANTLIREDRMWEKHYAPACA